MKHKIAAAALAMAMLFALLPAAAWAESGLPATADPAAVSEPAEEQPAVPQPAEEQEPPTEQKPIEGPPETVQGEEPQLPAKTTTEGSLPTLPAPGDTAADPGGATPAQQEPLLKFEENLLYTKGAPVVITAAEGGGINVTYQRTADQAETIAYAGNDAVIFGGDQDETHYAQASITLQSGTVSTIYGGGHGEDESADVDEVTIIVNGGKVTNCVYGGGLNRSVVKHASIIVNDGTIAQYALGGGAMDNKFGSGKDQAPSFQTALNGTAVNRTLNTSVVVNGGSVSYPMGGGQNYSYVGEAAVEFKGGTCSELVAGGSNGYTAKSTVTVSGGTVTGYLHMINRGAVGDAVLNLNGGTIADLYYGWNPADQSSEGPTTLENGGGIRSSLTVSYRGASVTGTIDKASGVCENAKVTEVKTNAASPEAVNPSAPDAEKQAAVDTAIKNAVDGAEPAKSGSTVISTTLGSDPTAAALLANPAMADPEEGFAEIVKNMADVGAAGETLVLSKSISAVHIDSASNELTSLVFDVAPVKVSAASAERLGSLPSPLTFRLPLPNTWPTGYVTVKHTHGTVVTQWEATVRTGGGSKWVELTSQEFSTFELLPLQQLTPAPTPGDNNGSGSSGGSSGGSSSKAAVVSLLDSTPKTGESFLLPALMLAACALFGLGLAALRRREH